MRIPEVIVDRLAHASWPPASQAGVFGDACRAKAGISGAFCLLALTARFVNLQHNSHSHQVCQ
jgi:hypothetical protein